MNLWDFCIYHSFKRVFEILHKFSTKQAKHLTIYPEKKKTPIQFLLNTLHLSMIFPQADACSMLPPCCPQRTDAGWTAHWAEVFVICLAICSNNAVPREAASWHISSLCLCCLTFSLPYFRFVSSTMWIFWCSVLITSLHTLSLEVGRSQDHTSRMDLAYFFFFFCKASY